MKKSGSMLNRSGFGTQAGALAFGVLTSSVLAYYQCNRQKEESWSQFSCFVQQCSPQAHDAQPVTAAAAGCLALTEHTAVKI